MVGSDRSVPSEVWSSLWPRWWAACRGERCWNISAGAGRLAGLVSSVWTFSSFFCGTRLNFRSVNNGNYMVFRTIIKRGQFGLQFFEAQLFFFLKRSVGPGSPWRTGRSSASWACASSASLRGPCWARPSLPVGQASSGCFFYRTCWRFLLVIFVEMLEINCFCWPNEMLFTNLKWTQSGLTVLTKISTFHLRSFGGLFLASFEWKNMRCLTACLLVGLLALCARSPTSLSMPGARPGGLSRRALGKRRFLEQPTLIDGGLKDLRDLAVDEMIPVELSNVVETLTETEWNEKMTESVTDRYSPITIFNLEELVKKYPRLAPCLDDIRLSSLIFPFKASPYVVDELIDWSRRGSIKEDPFYRLVFPTMDMLSEKHQEQLLAVKEEPFELKKVAGFSVFWGGCWLIFRFLKTII